MTAITLLAAGHALAQSEDVQRIAAVVNDQIITLYDLEGRTKLIILSSGLQDTPEIRNRVEPQIMRTLIDETLELQEAKRLNISVTKQEIDTALDRIAKQNNMTRDQFESVLSANNVPLSAITSQIRAGIAWSKVIAQKIRPTIEIGDDQIQDYLNRLKADQGKPEYLLNEIFLAVDSPQQDEGEHKTADRLAEQIRKGANFQAIARQFSQSATAANGGAMGWVLQDSLPPDLAKAVPDLKIGQISDPIRTVSGYYLLLLRDERRAGELSSDSVKLKLEHIFLQGPPDSTPEQLGGLKSVAEAAAQTAQNCADFAAIRKELPDAKSVLPDAVLVKDLAAPLRAIVIKLPNGKASDPIMINHGVLVMMVCSREGGGLPTADEVREHLGLQKLDLLARRYLRDLRTAAFVDVRV